MTTADDLGEIRRSNHRRIEALGREGISVDGLAGVATHVLLEHVLRAVGGEEAILLAQLEIEHRVALSLDGAEAQVEQARRARAAAVLGVGHVGGNGHLPVRPVR